MTLDAPEIETFIRRAMVARIATLSRSRRPSITPLYFSYTRGHLWLGTADWTLAAREVRADARVCVLLQNERNQEDRRILRVFGTATVRTEADVIQVRNRQQAFKYVLSPGGLLNQLLHLHLSRAVRRYRAQSAEKGQSCVIDVTPRQVEFVEEAQFQGWRALP